MSNSMSGEERRKANVIAPWLTRLALLTSAGKEQMTKERVFLYVQLLAGEIPLSAFTDASLAEIAGGCEFFPAYAPLKTALLTWNRDHTAQNRIAPPSTDAMHALLETRRAAERRDSEVRADWGDPFKVRESADRIGDDHPLRDYLGRLLASLVKRHAPQNLHLLRPEWIE